MVLTVVQCFLKVLCVKNFFFGFFEIEQRRVCVRSILAPEVVGDVWEGLIMLGVCLGTIGEVW